jgi:elongation factor Ts
MTITASMVKDLRERTGIAMMKCKKALEEADGDMEKAVEVLRKQGEATADKKAGRATNSGGIGLAAAGGAGVLVKILCETDFVSGNDVFKSFAAEVAEAALRAGVSEVEALKGVDVKGQSAGDYLIAKIQQLGENMSFAEVIRLEGAVVAGYSHGGRVASLVAGSGAAEVLRSVAMHIAASNPAPVALNRAAVDAELVAKEREIIAASADVQAKPEQIRPKIVDGKMNRFYKEMVLLEQEMLVDNEGGGQVEKWAAGKGASLSDFSRLAV